MKNYLVSGIVGFTLMFGGGVSYVFSQGDIDTSWIADGSTISSERIKANLDYLFSTKAPVPPDCDAESKMLQWNNDAWVCSDLPPLE